MKQNVFFFFFLAGSSGHRRTRIQMKGGQRLSGFTTRESRSQQLLFPCRGRRGCALPTNRRAILRAGEGGGGAWSSTGRGARPRMRPRRVQPSPRGGAHGAAPSSERPPAWGGEAAEKSHRDETRAPSLVGKKKKKPPAASKSRKPTQQCQENLRGGGG